MVLGLHQHIHHTKGLTTQGKRILRASWNKATAEGCHQIINLVSQGNNTTSYRSRLSIGCTSWHIMLVNSLGYCFVLTIKKGIFTTHNTLKLSELSYHAGYQVSLTELGCTNSILFLLLRNLQLLCNICCQFLQTSSLVVNRAKTFLEYYCLQLVTMLLQRLLAILIEEELGILKAGTKYALITMLYNLQMLTATIANGNKERHQLAILQYREIALMVTHWGDNSLSRELQILIINGAAKSSWIFYQIEDLLQQAFFNLSLAPLGLSQLHNLLTNHLAATVMVNDNELLLASLFIAASALNFKIPIREETMATGNTTGFYIGSFKINNILTIEAHQPTKRTNKLVVQISPVHVIWEIQAINQTLQCIAEKVNGLATHLMYHSVYIAILGYQVLGINTLASGKALGCLGRIAIGVKGDIYCRTAVLLGKVLLIFSQSLNYKSQTAWSTHGFYIVIGQTQVSEGLLGIFLKLRDNTRHCIGWNFLSTNF